MTAKTPKYTREWLTEALKLSLSSIKRGEDEKSRGCSSALSIGEIPGKGQLTREFFS